MKLLVQITRLELAVLNHVIALTRILVILKLGVVYALDSQVLEGYKEILRFWGNFTG